MQLSQLLKENTLYQNINILDLHLLEVITHIVCRSKYTRVYFL